MSIYVPMRKIEDDIATVSYTHLPLAVCLIPFWSVLIHPLSTLLDTTLHTAIL